MITDSERIGINAYLAKKWGLTSMVDSDNDGFTDAAEIAAGTDVLSITYPDLSDKIDAEIGIASGINAIEGNLALWLDATNINNADNTGLNNGDAISKWMDFKWK